MPQPWTEFQCVLWKRVLKERQAPELSLRLLSLRGLHLMTDFRVVNTLAPARPGLAASGQKGSLSARAPGFFLGRSRPTLQQAF